MLDQKVVYFINVVEEKSFSAAARKLFLSQANLSKQVALLEKELGVELFDRSGYRPILTNAGKIFYDRCKEIKNEIDNLYNDIKKVKFSNIEVGFTGLLENRHILKAINQFKKNNEGIRISFQKYNFEDTLKSLLNRTVDVSFGIESNFRHYEKIEYKILFNYEICVICSFDHPLAKYSKISIDMIKDEDFIVLSKNFGTDFYNDFMQACELDDFSPKIKKEEDSFDSLVFDVSVGEGIAIVSKDVVRENEVKIIDLTDSHHFSNYVIAYLKDEKNPVILSFIKMIIQFFQEHNF